MLRLLQVLVFICSAILNVQTMSVNRTIDDTDGDPGTGTYPTYNTEDWIPSLAPVNGYALDDTLHGCGCPAEDGACSMTLHFEGKTLPNAVCPASLNMTIRSRNRRLCFRVLRVTVGS
ncbi:hypothetical protein C8R45DRAFT_1040261 [Mycena sanguinolenta]|nr:hypothetical protein C8R45DRAFT_1040261 [Mycena sanguinolenta]